MAELVTDIMVRALDLVERERPDIYGHIAAQLDGLCLQTTFDDSLCLESRAGRLDRAEQHRRPDIVLASDRETLLDLLHGRLTVNQSVRSGRIELTGSTRALSRALEASEYFIGALLRIRSAEQLMTALES